MGARNENEAARQGPPGAGAETPTEVPARGWWQILRRSLKECSDDQVTLVAAGVAFFSFLSLFPALAALLMAYGLVTDPAQVSAQLQSAAGMLPGQARDLVDQQLTTIAAAPTRQLGVGLAIALVLALWSASNATGNLIKALDVAYEEEEKRGYLRRKALAIALTIAGLVVLVLLAVLASVRSSDLGLPGWPAPAAWGFEAVRWLLVVVLLAASLAVLYRVAPDRQKPRFSWVSVGAVIAIVLWLLATIGFSVYSSMGGYSEAYGAIAGAAVLMLWLWITAIAILVGAEINAESEMQTVRDTTTGAPRPLGQRGATVADTLPPTSS